MKIHLIVFYCFEALPFIVSLFYLTKIKGTYFKWFALYLTLIFFADITGALIKMAKIPNVHYYDYFVIPGEFIFYYWLFYKTFNTKKYSKLPLLCIIAYVISLFIDIIYFSKHQFPFYSFSYSVGNLLLLILILLFFIQLTSSDAVLTYRGDMMFWICVGLLIYFLGSFPYYGLRNTFAYKYRNINITYNYIVLILDCIMYLMFSLSFVWGKPNSRSSR